MQLKYGQSLFILVKYFYGDIMDLKYLYILDDFGNKVEYEIILAFKSAISNKNYVIYTDNEYTNGSLNLYASIYHNDFSKLDSIDSEDDWNTIENKLKEWKNNYE